MSAAADPGTTTVQSVDRATRVDDPATRVGADFVRFSVRVEALVRAATRDPDAAADAAQEAFVRLLREARAGRYPEHVQAWLHRTAMNIVISKSRRAAVAKRCAPALVRLDAPSTPDTIAVEREMAGTTRKALASLRPGARLAVVLAAQGVPGQEIAVRLGRSHAATRTLLCRARGQLRTALAQLDVA